MEHALEHAEKWHEGQERSSGESYIVHPIGVTRYLVELEAPHDMLIAALLHDVVEDGHETLSRIEEHFGKVVAELVDGVTKLTKRKYEGRMAERQIASLRKLLLSSHNDLRIILIKLADRKHNIETISALPEEKQRRIAAETLDIYVPFARLVGQWDIKAIFEDVCFPIVYPKESDQWHKIIEEKRKIVHVERTKFVKEINTRTTDDVKADLQEMTDYEIYRKLQKNIHLLENVRNIDSVHLIVQSDSFIDCYRVLGEVHAQYPIRIASFRDYVSNPQANGYRALHTTIFLSQKHEVRLRIQTQVMNEHTMHRKISSWKIEEQEDIYQSLSSLHASPQTDQEEYLRDLKQTVLTERIHVFTTSGDIFSLPKEATGVDFAFAVNPDALSYLSAVRVNGEVLEATYGLKEGDTVELILLENGKNDLQTMWVDRVKTVEARQKLKCSLNHSPKNKKREQGMKILEHECQKLKLPTWSLLHFGQIQAQLANRLNEKSFDGLLENIGAGSLSVSKAVEAYGELIRQPQSWLVFMLKFLRILPRTRILDKEASTIDIEVYAEDRSGLIHDITKCFAIRYINMASFAAYAVPPTGSLYKIRLEIKDFEEFSDLYDAMLQVPSVTRVLRIR